MCRSVRPTQILRPLKSVFDVEIRVAAAPAAELRRAGYGARVDECDARKPGRGEGSVAIWCCAAKSRPAPVFPKELPLWRIKPKRASLTSVGVKIWMYDRTAC